MKSLLERIYQLDQEVDKIPEINNFQNQTNLIIKINPMYKALLEESINSKDKVSMFILNQINNKKQRYLLKRKDGLESQIYLE